MKPIIKYIELDWGCTLDTGSDREIRNYHGSRNVRSIRPATEHDVAWVKAMGGFIPDGRIERIH